VTQKSFDAWLEKQRLAGGNGCTTELELALDNAEFVLALLTSVLYASDICRAESLRSLRKGKCAVPTSEMSGVLVREDRVGTGGGNRDDVSFARLPCG
jgi:hypothetical protein